ncbi:unnamed protein product [Bemisia tabaci]|uniref:Gametogenetin-binding protein 2-like n=1 Tax=Bemisia tabaci TaxID=7038 RepID=A0A9P0EYZ7_BEMTA|nr:PREDICTED: gametogenetin-binding protein 2-like [Bemisia tabaci]CAH0381297.1 unnamed protein product [Bemisia tabaci]
MAKLVDVFKSETQVLGKRQLPLKIDDCLTLVMDLNSMGLVYDNPIVRGKELDEFTRNYNILTLEEVKQAFQVTCKDLLDILSQTIPCVGCRRSVERLFYQLTASGHPALDPLVVTVDGILTIQDDHLAWPQVLCTLLHGHSTRLNSLAACWPRSRKSRRCVLHSLDSQRLSRPMLSWRDVWDCMRPECREEVALIDSYTLLDTLNNYLNKHRFCSECRTKVMKAYTLLVEEPQPAREKGYRAELYSSIRRCLLDNHVHLDTRIDYISFLIARAEPELMGNGRRERHAKSLEVAQEEVLTCLGLVIYERLYRIQLRLREEQCTCQVLAAVAIDALCRKFQMAIEKKRGVSKLELLCKELNREEQLERRRKESKKLKRKKKKEKKAEMNNKCDPEEVPEEEEEPEPVCEDCDENSSSSESEQYIDHFCNIKQTKSCKSAVVVEPTSCTDCDDMISVTNRKKNKNSKLTGGKTKIQEPKQNLKKQQQQQQQRQNQPKIPLPSKNNKKNSSIANGNSNREKPTVKCQSCDQEPCGDSHSERSHDCGYGSSENNHNSTSSSPEGSEVACSEGFCNHEGVVNSDDHNCDPVCKLRSLCIHNHDGVMSLEQMLEESSSSGEECFIPLEEIKEFQANSGNLKQKRLELRERLKESFVQFCDKIPNVSQFRYRTNAKN